MKSACSKLVQSLADCEGSPGCDELGVEFDHCGKAGKINQSISHSVSQSGQSDQSVSQSVNQHKRLSLNFAIETKHYYPRAPTHCNEYFF